MDIEALSKENRKRIMARLENSLSSDGPVPAGSLPVSEKPVPSWGPRDDPFSLLRVSLMRMNTEITELEGPEAIPLHVSQVLQGKGAPMAVVIGGDDGLRSLAWDKAGLKVLDPSGIESEYAGVSRALCAVAETGSVVFCSGRANPSTVNFMVRYHFAVISLDQILKNLEDLWEILRSRHKEHGPIRAVNLIGGPSATADVEATLTVGAHGPCRFELLAIDGQF